MAKGIAITWKGQVRYVSDFRVALDGVVRTPATASVSCGGVVREVWPSNLDPIPEGIQMTTDPVLARDVRRDGGPVVVPPEPDPPPTDPTDPTTPPAPPPVTTPIPPIQSPARTWRDFFQGDFQLGRVFRQVIPIPDEGVSISFVVDFDTPFSITIRALQVAGQNDIPTRVVSHSLSPLDFNGFGNLRIAMNEGLLGRYNGSQLTGRGSDKIITVGGRGRYYINLKNEVPIRPYNWIYAEVIVADD